MSIEQAMALCMALCIKLFGTYSQINIVAKNQSVKTLSADWLDKEDIHLLGVSVPLKIDEPATLPIIA